MSKKIIPILIITAVCFSLLLPNVAAKTPEETFILFIEAEDCTMNGYKVVDGNKGAVGKMISCDTANEQSFTVDFNVPADNQYTVWFKVWHVSQSDNSVLYDLNGTEQVFDFDEYAGVDDPSYFMLQKWYWIEINMRGSEPLENGWSEWGENNNQCRHTPIELNLKSGANSITFKAREAGHYIDQIIITDNLDYNPADVPGNETYICTFCNLPHYKLEPYEDFGRMPEEYWEDQFIIEYVEAEAETETAAVQTQTAKTTAPQTSDSTYIFIFLIISAVSLLFIVRSKKIRSTH